MNLSEQDVVFLWIVAIVMTIMGIVAIVGFAILRYRSDFDKTYYIVPKEEKLVDFIKRLEEEEKSKSNGGGENE